MADDTSELVSVGRVFRVFPGNDDWQYFGLELPDGGFSRRDELHFRPPDTDGSEDVVFLASTIEIEKKRTNVAHQGDKCAVRPNKMPTVIPAVGWTVHVKPSCVSAAEGVAQTFKSRPSKHVSERHMFT
ncbi:hypothetical protein ACFL0L_01295 [Patescibacteria group bacterium]